MRLGYWTFLETPRLPTVSERKLRRADKAWQRFNELVGHYRPMIMAVALVYLVQRLLPLILPVMVRFWFDPITDGTPIEIGGMGLSAKTLLSITVCAALAVVVLQSLLIWWIGRTTSSIGHRLVADIRVEIYEHLLRVPVDYVEKRGTGRVLLRFIGDSDALRLWLARVGPMAAADQWIVVILILVMLAIDAQLAILGSIPITLLATACYFFRNTLRQATRDSRNLQALFTGAVEERLAHLRQFKWFAADRRSDRTVPELSKAIAHTNAHRDAIGASLEATAGLIASTIVLLVLWVGINRVWTGTLSTGQLVAFLWIGFQLNETLKRLATAAVAAQKSWVSSTRILHLLSRSAEPGRGEKYRRRRWRAEDLEISDPTGGFSSVHYSSPGIYELPSAVDVEMVIEELLGFKKSRDLRISIDHKSVDEFKVHQVRQLIGWITTHSAVFTGTIKDNLQVDSSETHVAIASLPSWAEHYCPAGMTLESWLGTPAARTKYRKRNAERTFLSLVRSTMRGARIYLVEPDAYVALPVELWNELAIHAIVLRGANNSRSEPGVGQLCDTFSD